MYVGVDPGLKGAIAVLDESGSIVRVVDMPTSNVDKTEFVDASAFIQSLEDVKHAYIELVPSHDGRARFRLAVSSGTLSLSF